MNRVGLNASLVQGAEARFRKMLSELCTDEPNALGQFLHAADAVLDADPAVESNASQFGEDRVVIVEPPADRTVAKALGVSLGAGLLATQILKRSLGEGAVARMHRHDAALHPAEELERIVAPQERVAGVEVDAEVPVTDAPDKFAEDIHLLRKLREHP